MRCIFHPARIPPASLFAIVSLNIMISGTSCNQNVQTMATATLIPTKKRVDAPFGLGTVFEFTNNTQHDVKATGFLDSPPHDGIFLPSYTQYEVWTGKQWQRLDIGYDSEPEYYTFNPGEKCKWIIHTRVFEHNKIDRTTPVRIKIDEIYSTSFTLEDIDPID